MTAGADPRSLDADERRRRAEDALRASDARFRALVEQSADALIFVDGEGRVSTATPSLERHLGWPAADMAGRSLLDFIHPDDRDEAGARLAEASRRPGEAVRMEARFQHADRTWRSLECIGVNRLGDPAAGAVVINARDVTGRRRLEEQRQQAQKMEAVGRLAGGIAHDFNNLLTAILGYSNLLLEEMPAGDPLRRDLEEIREAGVRAAGLTRQLLAFSRQQMLQPRPVDLNALVAQAEPALREVAGEQVGIVTALAADLTAVTADPASIEQVLVNLAANGRDAMPEGGRLTIETAMVDLDAAYAAAHATVVAGRYARLAVSDTGIGMDAATVARVFEPFFTTKRQGRGVGLGLATVYGIVKQSGGYIWVYSEPRRGTVFKVYLPAAGQTGERRTGAPESTGQVRSGWETVLLVEDEDAVRTLARDLLQRRGYLVLEAGQGLEALQIAERHQGPIHLMVTDLVMPRMSGRDLAARFAEARPNMKVLFMSGYTERAAVAHELTPGAAFLEKPFSPSELLRTVRSVLDHGQV